MDDYKTGFQYGHKFAKDTDGTDVLVAMIDANRQVAYNTGDAFFLGIADYIWTKVLGARSYTDCQAMVLKGAC